jgi:hypothetical protein
VFCEKNLQRRLTTLSMCKLLWTCRLWGRSCWRPSRALVAFDLYEYWTPNLTYQKSRPIRLNATRTQTVYSRLERRDASAITITRQTDGVSRTPWCVCALLSADAIVTGPMNPLTIAVTLRRRASEPSSLTSAFNSRHHSALNWSTKSAVNYPLIYARTKHASERLSFNRNV